MRLYRGMHNGGWKYGYHSYDLMRNEDVIVNSQGSWPVIPETVGQQVGRQDKHKTEIYDGDKMQSGKYSLLVKWDSEDLRWLAESENAIEPLTTWNMECFGIIGNIH